MEFEVKWTGVPGAFDGELWLVVGEQLIDSVGGLGSVSEINAWARRRAAEYQQEVDPPVVQSGSHNFSL